MKKLTLLSSAVVAALLLPAAAHAQVVSVQFPSYYASPYNDLNGGRYQGPTPNESAGLIPATNWNDAMGPSTAPDSFGGGDGVVTGDITNANLYNWVPNPAPGSYPNNAAYTVSPNLTGLVDSTGAPSSLLFDVSGAAQERGNNNQATIGSSGSGDSQLVSGGVLAFGGTTSLALAGLNSNDYYVLVVYLDFDYYAGINYSTGGYNTASVSGIGSTLYALMGPQNTLTGYKQVTSTSASSPTLGNYVEYTNILGSTLENDTLTIGNSGGLAGFQIEDLGSTPAAVPEPSTVWMFSLGFLGLMAHVYRNRYSRS